MFKMEDCLYTVYNHLFALQEILKSKIADTTLRVAFNYEIFH